MVQSPLPSGISWASNPPTPFEFPIPSVVRYGYFLEPHNDDYDNDNERKMKMVTFLHNHFTVRMIDY